MKKYIFLIYAIALFFTSCKKNLTELELNNQNLRLSSQNSNIVGEPTQISNVPKYAPNEIIVKFREGKPDRVFMRQQNSVIKEFIHTAAMKSDNYSGIHVLMVPDVSKAVEAFKRNPNVEWVNPNFSVKHEAYAPNDTYYPSSLWGLGNIKAPTAWNSNIGDQQVYIGVIDEGIMYWHEDLCGQIWTNPYETENGVDDDGNGYIDDIHGWDFMHMDKTIYDMVDDHGTHVAGTIGGIGNNSKGVVGVSPNVTIISGKFLEGSGWTSDAVKAVDYMTDLKTRHGMNIAATSNSWGGGGYDQALYDAINRAKAKDILFVAAAGNDGRNTDITANYPSCYNLDNIISVAAYNSSETLPSWTNYGATTVDIGAPGVSIVSTLPGTSGASSYGSYSGTSMATPHVSGAVALYKAGNPTATYTQVRNAILNGARPIAALSGKSVTGGVLNVETFTTATTNQQTARTCVIPPIDATPPSAVTNYRVASKDLVNYTATLAWNAATDNVGVTKYELEIPYSWYTAIITVPSTTLTYTASGNAGTVYATKIRAYDAWNNKSPDALLTYDFGNDITPPATVKNFRVAGITPTSVAFAYDYTTDDWSGVGMYRISYRQKGATYWNTWSTNGVNPLEVPYLTTGVQYEFTMAAMDNNHNWCAETSIITETPRSTTDLTAPSAPTLSVAGKSASSVSLSWTAATDNVAVTGYNVYYKNNNSSYWSLFNKVTGTTATVNNLLSGVSYSFYVEALDFANNKTSSNTVTQTTDMPYNISISLSGTVSKKTNQKLSWTSTISPTGYQVAYTELQWIQNGYWTTLYTQNNSSLSGSYTNVVNNRFTQSYRVKITLTNTQTGFSNTVGLVSQVR